VVLPLTVAKPTSPAALGPPEDDELEELLDEDELELEEELELLDDEELELEELELDDELEELDELELLELEELLEDELLPLGIEHSLVPPATRVPAPKVASTQTKLPLISLKVNWSARP
jgi:hypothetical protein